MTRDEMAIFMVRAVFGSDNFTYSSTPYFTDVTPTTFGFKWIEKLKELGITAGCGATTYCPTDTVTRDEMAIFIERIRLGVNVADRVRASRIRRRLCLPISRATSRSRGFSG